MKTLTFILFSFLFCTFSVSAQQVKPTATPANQLVIDTPKKPTKPPKTAEEFYEAARWEMWDNRNDEVAIKLLDQAVKLKPDYIDAYVLRGTLKSRIKNCEAAIVDFDKVIELKESVINTYQYRAQCKIVLKNLQGALVDYDKSVANLAVEGKIQYNAFEGRGKVKYLLKDYDGAIKDFTVAANMNIKIEPYFLRALTYQKKGDDNLAIADFTNLSNYLLKINKELSKEFPDRFIEKDGYPKDENPLATLKKNENTSSAIGKGIGKGEAITLTKEVCKDCSNNQFAEFEDKIKPDGWFYSEDKIYLSLIIGMEDSAVIFYYLGDALEKNRDYDGAIKAFTNSIISKQYADELIRLRRGKLLLRTKSFDSAVRDFSWAISQNKNNAETYLERGIALQMLGHDELGQKDFDKYLKLNTSPDAKKSINDRIEEIKKFQYKPFNNES